MSDVTPKLEVPHGTVGYARKITPKQYESAELSIFVPFDMPDPGTTTAEEFDEQFLTHAKHAATQAKALVFEELGLDFELGPNGVLQEMIRRTFPGTTDVTPPPGPSTYPPPAPTSAPSPGYPPSAPPPPSAAQGGWPPSTGDTVANQPPYDPRTYDPEQKKANVAWARARMQTHPNEFYDNRPQKASGQFNPKGPDFKHRDTGIGIWIN